MTSENGTWVITLLPSSGNKEPEFPTSIHLAYGGAKGDDTFNGADLLVKDVQLAEKLFSEIESSMDDSFGLKTDRQRYHDTTSPDLFMRKLENAQNINAFVLRISWSAFLWNARKIQMAKELADVINRNIGNPDHVISPELREKAIGFADYTD